MKLLIRKAHFDDELNVAARDEAPRFTAWSSSFSNQWRSSSLLLPHKNGWTEGEDKSGNAEWDCEQKGGVMKMLLTVWACGNDINFSVRHFRLKLKTTCIPIMWTNVQFYSRMFKIWTHLHSEIKGCKTNIWQDSTTTCAVCYLRRGLQISNGNDFFVDKKLNGLFLPVVHIAVQLICVHSYMTQKFQHS